jgi:hypothetical protein
MKLGRLAKNLLYELVFLFLLGSSSFAGDLDAFFVKGNDLYQKGDYKAAIEEYSKILAQGYESWEVYYNLGNAYFKEREIGKAILNFEKAKRLNPKNEDIEFNLELSNLATVDRIPELPQLFLFVWISKFIHLLDLQSLGIVTMAIYLVWIGLLLLMIFGKTSRFRRLTLIATSISSTLLFVFAGTFVIRIIDNETKIEAIVLTDKIDVRSAPGTAGTVVFTLHEGVKVQIKDRSGVWAKIKLADGKVGWLKEEVIEKI